MEIELESFLMLQRKNKRRKRIILKKPQLTAELGS